MCALHDSDRNNDDRSSPAVNAHDLAKNARMAHGTTSIAPITDASPVGFVRTKNQQVIANDGTHNKALLGFQQGLGLWGLFVAEDGVDVNTNTDLSQFILNSNQNNFKVVDVIATSFSTTTSVFPTITHGLGYTPIVFATVDATWNSIAQGLTPAPALVLGTNSGVGGNYVISAFCKLQGSNSTQIVFEVATAAGLSYSGNIYCYVLQLTQTF